MSNKYVMFLGLILAAGTVISLTFGGAWFGTSDIEITSALSVFKQYNIFGIWSIALPNISFFLVGARALASFDFGFFGGGLALLQWFFFLTIGLGFIWGIYVTVIGVAQGIFRR